MKLWDGKKAGTYIPAFLPSQEKISEQFDFRARLRGKRSSADQASVRCADARGLSTKPSAALPRFTSRRGRHKNMRSGRKSRPFDAPLLRIIGRRSAHLFSRFRHLRMEVRKSVAELCFNMPGLVGPRPAAEEAVSAPASFRRAFAPESALHSGRAHCGHHRAQAATRVNAGYFQWFRLKNACLFCESADRRPNLGGA